MGKQQALPNHTAESLGIPDILSNNATYKAAVAHNNATQAAMYNGPESSDFTKDFIPSTLPASELNEAIAHGASLPSGYDPKGDEHAVADSMSGLTTMWHGLAKDVISIPLKLGEQAMNMASGVSRLLGADDFADSVDHNGFTSWLGDVADNLKNSSVLDTPASARYDSDNLMSKLMTAKFWADDVGDGAAFVIALALGSKGLGAGIEATGIGNGLKALSESENLAEIYKSIPVTERIATATANGFTAKTVGFLDAAAISGMQAKGTANQIKAKLTEKYSSEVNPNTGYLYTPDEIQAKIAKDHQGDIDQKVNNTFWATMATELLPSIYASTMILGKAKGSMGELNEQVVKAVNSGAMTTEDIRNGVGAEVAQKAGLLRKGFNLGEVGKAATVGTAAMNLQQSIQQYDVDQAVGGKAGGVMDSTMGYVNQFLDNFSNAEGMKSMVMGAILGAGSAAIAGAKGSGEYNEAMVKHLNSLKAAEGLFGGIWAEAQRAPYQMDENGKLKIGPNGELNPDADKVQKIVYGMLQNKSIYTTGTAALLAGNPDIATLNDHMAMAQSIVSELQSGRYTNPNEARQFFKWFHGQRVKEQAKVNEKKAGEAKIAESAAEQSKDPIQGQNAAVQTQTTLSSGDAHQDADISKEVNNNSQLVDKIVDAWISTGKQTAKLYDVGEPAAKTMFNDNIRRGLFYEEIKRNALTEMMGARKEALKDPTADQDTLAAETDMLGTLHQDSLSRSKDFLHKTDEIYKQWGGDTKELEERATGYQKALELNKKTPSVENQRAEDTAAYMADEHVAKNGLQRWKTGPKTEKTGAVVMRNDTNYFPLNNGLGDQANRISMGMRNEQQFRAGTQFREMAKMNQMIRDRKETGETTLGAIANYAKSKEEHIDRQTHEQLVDLTKQETDTLATDKQRLSSIPPIDQEAMNRGDFKPNPEYDQLKEDIDNRSSAIDKLNTLSPPPTPLDYLSRPEKSEEMLNRKFAEKQLDGAHNVIANALDDNGNIKDNYRSVGTINAAIAKATRIHDAMETRLESGDLKGQENYRYLVDESQGLIDQLKEIQKQVVINNANREIVQQAIGKAHATHLAAGLGFDLESNEITQPVIYNLANTALDGKLPVMLQGVAELTSHHFEGMMSVLHAVKSSDTDSAPLLSAIQDSIDNLGAQLPDTLERVKDGFLANPENYLEEYIVRLSKGEEFNRTQDNIFTRFKRNNDIGVLQDAVDALPEEGIMGIPKTSLQSLIRSYKEITSLQRVKNLIDSKLDLSKTVASEIEAGNASSGVVPTTEQEISIRDTVAWIQGENPGTAEYDGWAHLRGPAGTGKTSVAARWAVEQSGLETDEIIGTAATDTAVKVLNRSLGTEGVKFDEVLNGEIPEKTRLIIIDEYARVDINDLADFEQKIREHNKDLDPKDRVKVLLLGDPSQLKSSAHADNDVTNPLGNHSAFRIRAINPLATVYRADVSAVTEAADAFQYRGTELPSINVRASGYTYEPLNVGTHVGDSSDNIKDIIRINQEAEKAGDLTPRSRVIIVGDMSRAPQYEGTGVQVIDVMDTQSGTWDEVYVDIDRNSFPGDIERFNSAMYTAASRAKEYSFLKYKGVNSEPDTGLLYEKVENDRKAATAKGEYVKDRTIEQNMQKDTIAGKAPGMPAKEKIIVNDSPIEFETNPEVHTEDTIETGPESVNPDTQTDFDSEGYFSPSGPAEPPTLITLENTLPGEHILTNIEGTAYHQSDNIGVGTDVYYVYANQPNGEASIVVLGRGKNGRYVPLSRIFQEEINTHPHYQEFAPKIAKFKVDGIQPVNLSDINPTGDKASPKPETLPLMKTGKIARYQRLTYEYGNEPVKGTGLLAHITNLFKTKFYHSNPEQQAKGDMVHYRIFRKRDLNNYNFSDAVRAGLQPGIPYAVVGVKPETTDFRGAQFVRLTVNPLERGRIVDNQYQEGDEHYEALKAYHDGVIKMEQATKVKQGTPGYNLLMRALKGSLEIRQEAKDLTGTIPVVHAREDYTRDELRAAIHDVAKDAKTSIPSELDELLDPAVTPDEVFKGLLPNLQSLASQFYGAKEQAEVLTAKESLEKYGDADYKHMPFKGEEGDSAKGITAIKSTMAPGRKTKYKTSYELEAGAGRAQVAMNQLAKANEYVGGTRIRVLDHAAKVASKGRAEEYKGKSLISDDGGGAKVARTKEVLRHMLTEDKIAKGELKPEEADTAEVKARLNKQIREEGGPAKGKALDQAKTMVDASGLSDERKAQYHAELEAADNLKETGPITSDTMKLMVGDDNYNNANEHRTAEKYTVTDHKGEPKAEQVNTYLRKPLGVKEFNELGADPKKNAEALAKLVGTKLRDVNPTQVSVSHDTEEMKPEVTVQPPSPSVPGAERPLQDRINDLLAETKSPEFKHLSDDEQMDKLQELKELRAKKNGGTKRYFDTNTNEEDPGQKISREEAIAEFQRLLPGASAEELEFADRSLMVSLQNPGENLLGLFDKHKVTVLDENGIYKGVLRHEVFHSVWNDYLTSRERTRLLKAFDPYGKMDPIAAEEALANHFMNWQKQPEVYKPVLQRIFDKIKAFLGFAQDNATVMNSLFKRIEKGEFQQKSPEEINTRRAFSDMSKYPTYQDYKNATKMVEDFIYRFHVADSLDTMPVTRKELPDMIYQKILDELAETKDSVNSWVDTATRLKEKYELSTDPEERAKLERHITSLNKDITEGTQDFNTLYHFMNKEDSNEGRTMFNNLWKDLYPNIDLDKESHTFEDNDEHNDPDITEKPTDEAEEDKVLVGLGDFTKQSDECNQETKTTASIKNFLSFIFRPARYGKDEPEAKRISPRYAYFQVLRNIAGLSSSDPNFLTTLRDRAAENGINLDGKSNAALVVNHILNLHSNAVSPHYEFRTEDKDEYGKTIYDKVELDKHQRFINEDTFVTHTAGKDIRSMNIEELKAEGDAINRIERNKRSTQDFLSEVAGMVGEDKAKAYFRQLQAQESLRELYSTFLSQRQAQPMIAETEFDHDGEKTRYFSAQNYGAERIRTTDLETAFATNYQKLTTADWKAINLARVGSNTTGAADGIAELLSAIGMHGADDIPRKNTRLINQIAGDLESFESQLKQAILDKPKIEAADEEVEDYNPVAKVLDDNKGMLDRITRLLSGNTVDQRAGSYKDVKNNKRYIFHNGSQAYDTLGKMMDRGNASENLPDDKKPPLPEHFKDPVLKKNIFTTGLNKIFSIRDHDGWRQKGREEFAISYRDERNKNWLERNFTYGFLSFLRDNAVTADRVPLTYLQHFYTVSNRPRISSAEVKVLGHADIHEALKSMVEQQVTAPAMDHVKGYDRFKAVGFNKMHEAMEELYPGEMADKAKLYDKVQAHPEEIDKVARKVAEILKREIPGILETMEQEKVSVGDAHKAMKVLKSKGILDKDTPIIEGPIDTREGYASHDQLRATAELFHLNNYVNSFGINQAVAGNLNYFKHGENLIKRMSGIFAPGTKGTVGAQFFMKPKFKLSVSADIKMKEAMLSEMLKDTELARTLKKEGFDIADAQGYMTPERAADLRQGFATHLTNGQVFKPAHYEIAERGEGTGDYVPTMLKYSSVVITDDMAERFPKLSILRDEMRAKGVHEMLFDTGVKVGAPEIQTELPFDPDNYKVHIPDESILTLSNENYRLQLNPNHDSFDSSANPTQLSYFMNVGHKIAQAGGAANLENAMKLYQAVADRITRGISKQTGIALNSEGRFNPGVIRDMFRGVGNERMHEMLGNKISYNFPNIVDRAVIQMAKLTDKRIGEIRLPGGKLTLQSSYGADIPANIPAGQENFWSDYGKQQSANMSLPDGHPDKRTERRLLYQKDPATGRWHAEVMISESYRNKANVGDFLMPDMMGFRIPSTELHSSVPLKVVGYYDSKDSNVVIAPPELVAQHGSDFDVDSLYVISRETASSHTWEHGTDEDQGNRIISKGMPVGYYPKDGKLVFDPERFLNHLDEQRIEGAQNPLLLKKIEKLHDQLLNNQIVESFLDTISHPDNMERMLSPVSTEEIEKTMRDLKIEKDTSMDPSNLMDNMKLYNSNFQGLSLTGVFANALKALAYMVRTGPEGEYPEDKSAPIQMGDKVHHGFSELDSNGRTLWQKGDALINAAVDNVNLQLLHPINATDRTGMAYIAAATKMALPEAVMLMTQPVIKRYSNITGGKDTLLPNLKEEMRLQAVKLGILSEGQKYEDIKTALTNKDGTLAGPEVLTEKALKAGMKQEGLGTDASTFGVQYHALEQFAKLQKAGEDINTFSRAIGVLQKMPVFYKEVNDMQDLWDSMGTVTPEGTFKTKESFSYNLDNLFQAQPNIKAAYDEFQWMKAGIDRSVIKHQPEFQALAEALHDMKLRLSYDKNTNIELLKNEAMTYMVSSYYADSLKGQESIRITSKNGKERNLTGKAAWGYMFMDRLKTVLDADRTLPEDEQSPLLRRMTIRDQGYGNRVVEFANTSNPDPMESAEMQEGFGAIKEDDIRNDLVKYAALNYGMQFGIRNYSMFIPTEYLKPISDYIDKQVQDYTKKSTLDDKGRLIDGPLHNAKDNLALKIAVNYPEKFPYLSSEKYPPLTTKDAKGQDKTIEIGGKTLQVRKGYDKDGYWNIAYKNPLEDNGTRKHDFPRLMRRKEGTDSKGKGRDVTYLRVNENDNDQVLYQRLGYKNYLGGYDATPGAIDGEYKTSDYFGPKTVPVPVRDVGDESYESNDEYVQPGQRVLVYPWSNETRELGKFGIVDKITNVNGRRAFTLEPEVEGQPEKTTPEVDYISAIAREVGERFNLSVVMGDLGEKGKASTGVINLNPKKMDVDTPYHEVSHPLVAAIQEQNPEWYSKLQEELHGSPQGKNILRKVKAAYPELDKKGQEREALVTAMGLEAKKSLESGTFRDMVKRLMRSAGVLLKSVLKKIKGGESLNLDDLKNEDMVKLTIGDLGDMLAHKNFKLDLSKIKIDESFSRDLEDEKPKGLMEAILERDKQIISPERDETGRQSDSYTAFGDKLLRASKVMEKFLFRKREQVLDPDGKPMASEDVIAKREADRQFKNIPLGQKKTIEGKEYTKEEYQEARKNFIVTGMLKGDIIHAQLQKFFTTDGDTKAALTKKIADLSAQIANTSKLDAVKGNAYSWITEGKYLGAILKNAGIHVSTDIPENQRDRVYSEIKVASPELGAGQIDQLVQRPDGRLKIVDWKTGRGLRDRYTSNILQYGLQEQHITDNPLDRAKLQIVLYSLMIKAEHPEAKFDGGVVMHIPNEGEATQSRNAIPVEYSSYLKMIEQYMRNEEPENYRKLIEKSPSIFDPNEYNAPRDPTFTQDVVNSGGATEAEVLHRTQLQLQNVVFNADHGEDAEGWNRYTMKLRNDLLKKILAGSNMVPVDFTGELGAEYDIKLMKSWLGNINDTHNPYIQTWATMFNLKKEAARQEFRTRQREFKGLLNEVLEEKGIKQNAFQRALFWVDKQKAFSSLVRTEVEEQDGENITHRYFVEKGMKGYDQLTDKEKALSDYTAAHMREIFEHVMVKGPEAIINPENGWTKLDQYNKSYVGGHFEYKKGFFPAHAITEEEVAQQALRDGIITGGARYIKDRFLRRATDYFENNVEGYNQADFGIPVRYLRDTSTSPDNFTSDVQLAFEKYMEQMINKKHMDSVWVTGQALKGYLEGRKDASGNKILQNSAEFMGAHLKLLLEGDKKRNLQLTRFGLGVTIDGKPIKVSLPQVFRSLKSAIAVTNLFVKPLAASKNWAQMEYMQFKEEAINSVLRHGNFAGVNKNELELSLKHHAASMAEAIGGQFTQFGTSADGNFIHQLAKQLRLYPDMSEMNLSNADNLTRGGRLLTTKVGGYLYQATEEVTSVQYALSFMKAMQISSGPYKGKSMYDMYKENFNPATGEFKLPNDFRRGQILTPQGTYDELTGLHPMEVQHIHRGIQTLKGGYRQDERTRIQATILGDLFLQFKRWIPGMLVKQFTSKYADPSIGQFERMINSVTGELEQHNGEDVYQWRARIVEGRWNVLGKTFVNLITAGKMQGYAWADLSTEQKKSLIDAGISLMTWTSLGAMGMAMSHRKDQDTLKGYVSSLQARLFEQWNTLTLLDEATTAPATVQKITGITKGVWELIKGGTTNKGDLKGLALVEKNMPYLASYYELHKEIADWDTSDIWDTSNPYQ